MHKLHEMIHRLHNTDLGSLFIRIALGTVFIHAGWLKVTDMSTVITGFTTMGFPSYVAYFVSYVELISGIAMILGIFVRYAGILLAITMLVATIKVHLPNGFGLQNGGYEYTLVLFLISLGAITLGAGKYSLACLLKNK